ncbi:hypothetical protein BYT27DRAFT_7263847 [Phlegmacium glaucopus]|nr:hypothetical protein BYT27DRAFT_7263847 [Phlegmacium glaucopus]
MLTLAHIPPPSPCFLAMDKDKGRTSRNPASAPICDGTLGNSQRGLATRSEINALVTGNSGPITNSSEARKWLETKGWVLSREDYDRSKMARILLTISLLPKMPQEAVNAIRATAFILEDDITDKDSSSIASLVVNKVQAGLTDILSGLLATQTFFKASSTQQANLTLDLKESMSQSKLVTNNLSNVAAKLTDLSPPPATASPPIQWPAPSQRLIPCSLPPNVYDPSVPSSTTQLRQRLLLAARSILVQSDPDDISTPSDRSPLAVQKIHEALNQKLVEIEDTHTSSWDSDDDPKPKTSIKGVQILKRGVLRLQTIQVHC